MTKKPVIIPFHQPGSHRTGSLPDTIKVNDIKKVLGFKANLDDDKSKVKYSWGFTVNGHYAAIWDYHGARWSTYDPKGVLPALFKDYL